MQPTSEDPMAKQAKIYMISMARPAEEDSAIRAGVTKANHDRPNI